MSSIKLFLVDDQQLFREALAFLFQKTDCIEVVGQAGCGSEVADAVKAAQPDVVMLDLVLPDMNGLDAIHIIKEVSPKIKIMILSGHNNLNYVIEALKYGVKGFLTKNLNYDDLINAIRIVYNGNTFLNREAAEKLAVYICDRSKPGGADKIRNSSLSAREKEVLKLICKGKTNNQIAQALFLSVHTIVTHRRNIFQKANVKNTAGLVRYASEQGLLI